MNCIHGKDMGTSCAECGNYIGHKPACPVRVAEQAKPMESTHKVKGDDFEFGDPIVQIALHQSSVKRMDDTVQELSRNVADLTSVARALLAIGNRITEPKALDVEFPEVMRGPVTDGELSPFWDWHGKDHNFSQKTLRSIVNELLRSRGVL